MSEIKYILIMTFCILLIFGSLVFYSVHMVVDSQKDNVIMTTMQSELLRMGTEIKDVKKEEMRLGVVSNITETALNHVGNNITYDFGENCAERCH